MMKKITTLLIITLALSGALFTGCGAKTTYNDTFKTAFYDSFESSFFTSTESSLRKYQLSDAQVTAVMSALKKEYSRDALVAETWPCLSELNQIEMMGKKGEACIAPWTNKMAEVAKNSVKSEGK